MSQPAPVATIPVQNSDNREPSAYACLLGGGALLIISVFTALGYFVLPFIRPNNTLETNTGVASFGAIAAIYGAVLLLLGWDLLKGPFLKNFALPPPAIFLALFVGAILIGQLVLVTNIAPAYLFPPLHVAASLLIPLAVLSYASRRIPPTPARAVLAEFSWGGLATVVLALLFELIGGAIVALIAGLLILVLAGPDTIVSLLRTLTSESRDVRPLADMLFSNPTLLIIAGGAAVFVFVILAPLFEEIFKSLGPAILISRKKPTRATALLWGLAAGAGYAFSENLLNGQGGVSGGNAAGGLWAGAMILRAGTSLMHMAATATVTMGWYGAIILHRRGLLVGLLLLALFAHGLWNIIAVAVGGVSALSLTPVNALPQWAIILLVAFGFSILIALFVGSALWIIWLVRYAVRADAAPVQPAMPADK